MGGERENFEVSEKRFDREVQNAEIMREVKRRQQFENTQDIKKRKIEEKSSEEGSLAEGEAIETLTQCPGTSILEVTLLTSTHSLEVRTLNSSSFKARPPFHAMPSIPSSPTKCEEVFWGIENSGFRTPLLVRPPAETKNR